MTFDRNGAYHIWTTENKLQDEFKIRRAFYEGYDEAKNDIEPYVLEVVRLRNKNDDLIAALERVEKLGNEWLEDAEESGGDCPDQFCGVCSLAEAAVLIRSAIEGDE